MRDYRGKRKDGKGWVHGCYIKYRGDHFILPNKVKSFLGGFIKVISETVGQDTGCQIYDETKVYGGDKISFTVWDWGGNDTQCIGIVTFIEGSYVVMVDKEGRDLAHILSTDDEATIIGGVHDDKLREIGEMK